ncbi:LuxR C-terminal-related transcriptional regulator [Nonomuraea purpurea]|uniref:LuxR C-terminal-related transcriptional regulator n=1 Tax=Nonomuraea purpurea TaxID=1849276 RepID=A0ABV8G4W5_9ACTN
MRRPVVGGSPLRVLVADDEALDRAGLAALISACPGMEVAGESAAGEEAVSLALAARPDVVLLNVRVPATGDIATVERILASAEKPAPRVLVLGGDDLHGYVYRALRAGAAGFLLKDTPPALLLSAIRTVAEGHVLLAPSAIKALIDVWRPADPIASAPDLRLLTRREAEVLALVGRGMSNRDIAGFLSVSEATVKTHLNRAMAKLGLSTRAHVVALAYDRGLVKPRCLPA